MFLFKNKTKKKKSLLKDFLFSKCRFNFKVKKMKSEKISKNFTSKYPPYVKTTCPIMSRPEKTNIQILTPKRSSKKPPKNGITVLGIETTL